MRALNRKMCVTLLLLLSALSFTYGADSSVGAHLGLDSDGAGDSGLRVGLDYRLAGGRGVYAQVVSVEFLAKNVRDYNSSAVAPMLLASWYPMAQASLYYGDLAFYAGPGISYYVQSGGNGGGLTLIDEQILHARVGLSYTIYPLQIYLESDTDIHFSPFAFDIAQPQIQLGVSLMR